MKRYVLSIMLAAIFVPALAVAQEEGPEDIKFRMDKLILRNQESKIRHLANILGIFSLIFILRRKKTDSHNIVLSIENSRLCAGK